MRESLSSPRWRAVVISFGFVALFCSLAAEPAKEAPKLPAADKRTVVGKSAALFGTLFRRTGTETDWKTVSLKEDIHSGDLLVALALAPLELRNGIHLAMMADMDGQTRFPAIESAVVLHDNPDVDVDFTLDRGRVAVINHRDKGEARVKVRFRNQVWDLTLAEPKTRIVLEMYGRWPRGVPFSKDPKAKDVPTLDLVMVLLKGRANVNTGSEAFLLKAPPEPCFLHWDSVSGLDEGPVRLPKLPPWADDDGFSGKIPLMKKLVRLERFHRLVKEKSLGDAVDDFAASDNPNHRRFAVYAMGALDDLPRLTDVLTNPKHRDAWETGVLALRHWLGRAPGQDLKYYDFLVKNRGFTPGHAEIVMKLAHGFGESELSSPEVYELLIEYLKHDKLPIRGLANWHLHRLVSAGKKIDFDPTASAEEREKAYREWKKLVPDGKLPAE